jgi:hypothetical protein
MGIAFAYVSENWTYEVCHLGLKYIAWTHQGKYLAIPFSNIIIKYCLEDKISQSVFYELRTIVTLL